MEMKTGFIGLGMMGKPMAMRLLERGFPLCVYNRTPEKTRDLVDKGARKSESPRSVMEESDVVISMVSDSKSLDEITGGDQGTLAGVSPGKVHVDMSTVSPSTTEKLGEAFKKKQAVFLHAPVLGSVPEATGGTLLVFVGGDRETSRRCEPVFNTIGRRVWYFDEVTKASHMKLICNLFIASMLTVLSEGLVFAQKVGVPPTAILEVLKESSLAAPTYQTKGNAMLRRDFSPRFMVTHMHKDLNLILDAARAAGVPLPPVEAIRQLYTEAKSLGLGNEDYSAVIKVVERAANVQVNS
jgi:3-hydroxyisobutyrate dehydrogenase-like beta-hydroxyacid dehydrogenase